MHDDLRPLRALALSTPTRPWAQPRHIDEPILDAARVPLSIYLAKNGPAWSLLRKLSMYIWLHLFRPVFTVAVWSAGLFYAWRLMLGHAEPQAQHLLWIYAAIIGTIFVGMLIIAPLRRDQHRETRDFKADDSTLMALAEYVALPPAQLTLYQQAKRLQVHHNKQGRLDSALHAPLPAPVPKALVPEAL